MVGPAALVVAATSEFEVRVLRGLEDLEALAAAWDRLAATASTDPMQSHAWSLVAARTLHAGDPLNVITVHRGSQLAAVAPLVEVRRRGGRWLEFLGGDRLYEPMRLLAESDAARTVLCREIARQRRPMLLQRLDRGEWTAELRRQARGRAIALTARSSPCLRVDLAGGFDALVARLSSERASTLRRKRRQLERAGEVRFESLQPTPAQLAAVLREAFEVESRGWKGEAGSAVLSQPDLREFFRGIAAHFAASGALRVRRLLVGGEIAAVNLGVVQANRYYELKIGFDEKWARQSPGVLLTLECLRDGCASGLQSHEFLGSAAAWQEPFATGERSLENLALYPLDAAGLAWLGLDVARFAYRRAARLARGAIAFAIRFVRSLLTTVSQKLATLRERWFDWRHSVETVSRVAVADLHDIDARLARHAVHYEATSIRKFERALAAVGARADGFTFIDLGSGKGRVLMMAALRPFRRVIGVELSRALHDNAVANVARFAARNRDAAPIECICDDASAFELPEGNLLVFLYNPFDANLLVKVRDRMLAATGGQPRQLCVVYVNPLHHALFEQGDCFERVHRDASFAVYWRKS